MHTTSMTDPDLSKLIAANNDFGFQLLTWLVDHDAGRNVFISSFSVAMALTMTYNGAEGKTMAALAKLLGLSGLGLQQINEVNAALMSSTDVIDPKVQLIIANSIWLRDGVTPSSDFSQRIKDYYAGEVASLDFGRPEAAALINRWVADKTRGHDQRNRDAAWSGNHDPNQCYLLQGSLDRTIRQSADDGEGLS